MPFHPTMVLPKQLLAALKKPSGPIRVSPRLLEIAGCETESLWQQLDTTVAGLSQEEAEKRLEEFGPNVVAQSGGHSRLGLLGHALVNPLVILLSILACLSFLTGDPRAGAVMSLMVLLGVLLRFAQEARADTAAAKLKAMIGVTATVLRDGQPKEVPITQLVPGDVVKLAAGDMIPGDIRIVSCKDLFVIQNALTGESYPVEKSDARETQQVRGPLELRNIAFLGTSVESGSGTAIVVETGLRTYLGGMASVITAPAAPSGFDLGVARFTWLMISFMLVMVPLVFLINGLTKGDWGQAFFFAMAVAVGMTPEMLPMIVTVCLSKGAIAMARKKVIVKRLNSIQNLGAMDVLCTDKTGTLTIDRVILEKYCDVVRQEDDSVLELAYLNSYFQTGLKNVLDRAVLAHRELHVEMNIAAHAKADEIPFDFSRKVMSVVVQTPRGQHRLITKGAPEAIYQRCSHFELQGQVYPMEQLLIEELKEEYENLSTDGFRVLALAYRDMDRKAAYSRDDETGLILKGYLAFLDPPKESAVPAIRALQKHGVAMKVLTGDNDLVSRKICKEVGIETQHLLLGQTIETMTDAQLAEAAENATLFARLSPAHKQRIIHALRARGHVVGFLGDGINDAPALRAADVGISVDTAVDIARESADAILLEKSLMVLEEGVLEGRKVFANILKYIRMGASSNFGNVLSVVGASLFLPFLPMAPIQILTNNLLYNFSQIPIPTDDVDPKQVTLPRPWSMHQIAKFILFFGPCSSLFDYLTFLMMWFVFDCRTPAKAALFQTGWFVESLLTQTLIIHVIRTERVPFLQSRASLPLTVTCLAVVAVGIWLPFSSLASALEFTALPRLYWPLLLLILGGYLAMTQAVKVWLLRRNWV